MSPIFLLVKVFLLRLHIFPLVGGQNITLYYHSQDHKASQNLSTEVSIHECTNLPQEIADNVIGVHSLGKCVRIYGFQNCSGDSMEIVSFLPLIWPIGTGFGFGVSSVGPCRDVCDPEVLTHEPPLDEEWTIHAYTKANFEGSLFPWTIVFDFCGASLDFVSEQIGSVRLTSMCFQLFTNQSCVEDRKLVEVRLTSLNVSYFPKWLFRGGIRYQRCEQKCASDYTTTPEKGEAIIYSNSEFRGAKVRLTMEGCVDLRRFGWNGTIGSMKAPDGSCTALYTDDDAECHGNNFSKVYGSIKKASFPGIESVRPCGNDADNLGISTAALTFAIVIPLLIAIGMTLWMVHICKGSNKSESILSEREIREFREGLGLVLNEAEQEPFTNIVVQNRPFDKGLEVSRELVSYDATAPLGHGEFGVVYKGRLKSPARQEIASHYENLEYATSISVAVKTVKPNSSVKYLRSLLKEVKILTYVGPHPRIVEMVGCCTDRLEAGNILVLLEFCEMGSLESYLCEKSSYFTNFVVNGKLEPFVEREADYANVNVVQRHFNTYQLMQWCMEIAEAMEFLSTKKIIHGDIATRNVLLTQSLHVKVSDFGMSRQMYGYSEYVKKKAEPLPWRWMAIESLKSFHFSTKSDVWSYGVTCWEIFSLGDKPYTHLAWTNDFIKALENGLRPEMPPLAPFRWYCLMSKCWSANLEERPEFTDILCTVRPKLAKFIKNHWTTFDLETE